MIQQNVINFFTDASIVKENQDMILGGTYGFLRVDNNRDIKDEFAGYSLISNIQYLECKAIYYCLLHILKNYQKGVKYYIFTDSSTSYDYLKKACNGNGSETKHWWFNRQVTETELLIKHMIQIGIDIHIIDIKGHCKNSNRLLIYLNNKTPGFSLEECKLIIFGNTSIDKYVRDVSKHKELHSYILYDT